ncbi:MULTISPECIES: carbohydrate ABC transporter permease [Pseudonocardia]|uniref:L-arabinose transport system permease protein AraQ n=2 Tax=Pseudonocardia TaxID=1847 RepID=A0A1Y2MKW1_PSEAH|nr:MULTISPECIES: carbohydrate ABC transporter permease [Pseudonocardia]OSY35905.1 L-arabinose transport system permease protein AraQ [Pseudonocardia autotrophica]TDN73987.1 carbohydrate ABC transporter membrane protein 2 (CUT1 family) [Pseudonocardia autotrophica]BBG04744.1 sn-glycerol-3-phosphate transport system permease protein UgpE [Pseudonocardia autotrophica]GEC28907.1 sn-glycerol-3-phosphate transport system permease protein UgpE [Pseudonocardia saturnea]
MAEHALRRERRTGNLSLLIAVPVAIVSIAPLLWALISSLRAGDEIFAHLYPLTWRTVVPESITLDNYIAVLTGPFAMSLVNSVIVAFFSVTIGLFVAAMAGFALAALDFPGRGAVFALMVVSFLIPFEAIAIPLSTSFRDWGLANTYAGLILPAIGNGLSIFLLRQFFLGIPKSLSEAARLDGLSWFGVFWRIYLPLSKAPLVGAGLILFVFQWQSFLWPLLIAPAPSVRVAPVAIADFAQEAGVDYGQMFAGAILASAIPLILLLLFQRQFTNSLASSGSKE